MRVGLIPANPFEPIRFLDIEEGLKPMQELVGGYIEAVRLPDIEMYVDEEGLLKGLPLNIRATLLYRQAVSEEFRDQVGCVGDAVAFGGVTPGGKTKGLSKKQEELLINLQLIIDAATN